MAGEQVQCFWCVNTGEHNLYLRRYTHAEHEAWTCEGGWHQARLHVGREPEDRNAEGYSEAIPADRFAGDPRWPTHCDAGCGYAFTDEDHWQVFSESIYRTADGSTQQGRYEWEQRELPPGAMFDSFWMPEQWRGPDGLSLTVVCPPTAADMNTWNVDMPATVSGGRWTRTGDPTASPPTVDVSPSIEIGFGGGTDGTEDTSRAGYYHGHLRHGVLVSV